MKTAFGLDIAGYSTGKSGFARADFIDKNSIEVTVYPYHIFSKTSKRKDEIKDQVKMEKELLLACCKKGTIFVDIPIDLQSLLKSQNVFFTWELTLRPVDFAFDAMPPLADRIGSPVARFLNLFSSLQQEDSKYHLGKQIFETYPAGSLMRLKSQIPDLPNNKYKKQTTKFCNGIWKSKKEGNLSQIANCLKLTSEKEITISDDDLDAIICAITGIVDEKYRLHGNELTESINSSISNGNRYPAPMGYVLLKKKPEININITKKIVKSHKELLKDVER